MGQKPKVIRYKQKDTLLTLYSANLSLLSYRAQFHMGVYGSQYNFIDLRLMTSDKKLYTIYSPL